MKLKELLNDISITKDVDIKGITNNSNEVKPGYLFIAVKGSRLDGNQFIEDAISRGAVSVLYEDGFFKKDDVVFMKVNSVQERLCGLAKRFYGDPSLRIKVVGITGTNGKTTTAYLIKKIFEKAGIRTGLLGTINYIIGDRAIPAVLTTPDVLKVNKYLYEMVNSGCRACVMEVSSHALEQDRVGGINFQAGVYTNLGKDHMDYHKTVGDYLEAKAKLFKKLGRDSWAVINSDDPYSEDIIDSALCNVVGYGIENISSARTSFRVKAKGISISREGTTFSVYADGFKNGFGAETKLLGRHNVYNILAAIGVALSFGIDVGAIKEGILATSEIPGRLEKVDMGQTFSIFIDYAHTPDAMESVLNTLRAITKKRLILVFGCGGDRDKDKRPLMGRIANKMADYTFITTDNPRTEDPQDIINDIKKGFAGDNYISVLDRKEAIKNALDICRFGDILVIAGKGHENYQILKNTVLPFSDRAVVEELLASAANAAIR